MDPRGAGSNFICYLDDFLFFKPPQGEKRRVLKIALNNCTKLGVSIHKTEGPTQFLTFLGIEVATVAHEI